MKVLGLLLTLTTDATLSVVEQATSELPGLKLGDIDGSYLAAVLEGDSTLEIDSQLDALERTPGVTLVQVVSAYWDEPDGDEHRRFKRKYHRSPVKQCSPDRQPDGQTKRADGNRNSLNGEAR